MGVGGGKSQEIRRSRTRLIASARTPAVHCQSSQCFHCRLSRLLDKSDLIDADNKPIS